MANKWRIFSLLMWKNLIVRKRHWKIGLLVQICLPIALFILTQFTRELSTTTPVRLNNDTHYDILRKEHVQGRLDMSGNFIYFLPKNNFIKDIMDMTRLCLELPVDNVVGFSSEDELLKEVALKTIEDFSRIILAVVFKNPERLNSTSKNLDYKIRSPVIPRFPFATPIDMISGFSAYVDQFPFVQVQMCLDESFLKMKVPNSSFKSEITLQRMPDPPHIQVGADDEMIRTMYAVTAVMAFLIPLCIEATFAANEKFIGVNILMSMNGVKNYQNLLSWLVSGLLFSILYIIPLLILFTNTFVSDVEPYLYYGNVFIVTIVLLAQITHLIAFGMHIASYFSKSLFMISGILALYVGSTLLQRFIVKNNVYTLVPYLGIIFPNYLIFRTFQEISVYEKRLTGVRWSNLFLVGDVDYPAVGSLGGIFLFSILGTLLHFFLTLYAYSVFPGKYGVPKHLLFFLMRSKLNRVSSEEELYDCDYKDMGKPFEPVPKDVYTPGIQIRNLKKSYHTHFLSRATHQALRGISIDFYKGQITALLGHNGAGKTTMMSILTGLLSPTEGMVFINGKRASDEMDEIVNDLGLCPQEDMLFPDLDVFEQIEFFGLLKSKNKTKAKVRSDVNDLLKKLKLLPKRNVVPAKLSGGQKRRVCLGMAIIGDASTLILDEPTSGMDPESRRDTWDILLKMRGEKTILISTHNMEEADILGDRTAIIHLGKLKSYGTPMFLKKLYGQGNIEVTLSTEKRYDLEMIKSQLSGRSQLINLDGGRIVFSVPYTSELPNDLDKIEEKKKDLGVNGISVSLITLEQVFLKATKEDEDEVDFCRPFVEAIPKVTGRKLLLQSAVALFSKKFIYTLKNILTLWLTILIPLISILLIGLDFNSIRDTSPEVPLRLDKYRYAQTFYSSNEEDFGNTYKKVVEKFNGEATNVGATNISEAMLDLAKKDLATFRNNLIAAATFQVDESQTVHMNAFFSHTSSYSIPISVNLLSNTLLKALVGEDYEINVWSQKFPNLYKSKEISETNDDTFVRVLLLIAFLYPTVALYVIHPLRESSSGMKQLQRMTGIPSWLYWGTLFLFDFLIFIVSILFILLGFYAIDCAFDIRMFRGTEIGIMTLLLVLFALNALPLIYIFSFLKKSTSTVITMLSVLPLGAIAMEMILHVLMMNITDLKVVEILRRIQKKLFLLIPYISFFHGQLSFFETAGQNAQCRRTVQKFLDISCIMQSKCCGLNCVDGKCEKSLPYFGNFKGDINLEESVLYLSLTPLIYFAILGLLEHKIIPLLLMRMQRNEPKYSIEDMDDQVKKEKFSVAFELSKLKTQSDPTKIQGSSEKMNGDNLIANADAESDAVFLVYELSKYYGTLPAVKEISFCVKKSECFGLLGVNGAGKSTTFRMLTGDEFPNSGVMFLGEKEIYANRKEYLSQMGYCPQHSALMRSLNAKDHLRLFALLRGIPRSQVTSEVEKWINRLNLTLCAVQPSRAYSGGNKRRLNIAIALIGNPNLVLLDEPTTGVDPAARRSLWRVIKSCQLSGQSIILTSHSMEECEALCNRLVIMVRGQLVCIGPSQQLKQRFGAGYDINVKLNPQKSVADVEDIKKDIETALDCELRDEHVGYVTYHVTNSKTTWKTMYGVMENLKEKYSCIEDFTVLSATLEQLFLQFARSGVNDSVVV